MITKERLEELIKQGATIYENRNGHILEISFDNTDIRPGYKVQGIYLTFGGQESIIIAKIENLFETEEDARWELEMTATRTETLKLPTWEEFITNDKYNYYRTSYFEFGDSYRLIVKLPSEDDDCEFIGIDVDGNCELYHWEEATKENYIEACKLAKKLFLGEEV